MTSFNVVQGTKGVYDTRKWDTFGIPKPASQGQRIAAVPRPWMDSLVNETPPIATGKDGRIALELVLAAYVSPKEGRRVTLPLTI